MNFWTDEQENRFCDEAEKLGLNLNYTSTPFVDIATLTTEQWREVRKSGIGGSNAGTIMGVSKFNTITDAWLDKTGQAPDEVLTPEKAYMFNYGHVNEPVIAKYFCDVTGLTLVKDNHMYRHPNGVMLADFDYLLRNPEDGSLIAGLEIKTSSPSNKGNWKPGVVGDTGKLPASYEWQVRHYMAVRNINHWFAIVSFGNNAAECVIVRVDRDALLEKTLIDAELAFWDSVKTGTPPVEYSLPKEAFVRIANRKQIVEEEEGEPFVFAADLMPVAKKIEALQEEISALTKQAEAKKAEINALALSFTEQMGEAKTGYLDIDDNYRYVIDFKDRRRSGSLDSAKLQTLFPEAYNACFKATDKSKPQRTFSMKQAYKKTTKKKGGKV